MSSILSWIRRPATSPRLLMVKRLCLIVPPFAAVGAAMEMFMIQTGFYEVATRKEAERRMDAADDDYQRHRQERKKAEQQEQLQKQQQQEQKR